MPNSNQGGGGRQGSGNFGNPQQHARAGSQSHKNDSGSRGGQQGNQGEEQEFEGDTAVQEQSEQESMEHQGGIEQLKELMQHLQADRQMHQNAVMEIDEGLREVQRDIDEIMQQVSGEGQEEEQGGGNRGRGQGGKGQTRSQRGGNETGTSVALRLLQENKGEMKSTELRDALQKEGIKSPYSSIYSLTNSGKIEKDGDMIRLIDEEGGGGGGRQGGRGQRGGNRGSGQDRNNDGKGRGNFGNPQQHAEAGKQSSGNRGNVQQHAQAGSQSHKNDR